MSRLARRAMALIGSLLVVWGVAPAAAAEAAPSITVDRTGAREGEIVTLTGSGWSAGDLVYLELCGNGGRGGSSACDQGRATLVGTGPEGTLAATMTIGKPPVPCPCVVKATGQKTSGSATDELAIQDVPVVSLEDQDADDAVMRAVEITAARIERDGSWRSWFGAASTPVLSLTITNTGDVAVHDPPVSITLGRGDRPSGIVAPPEVGSLEPGDAVTLEIPLRLGALAFGEHTARIVVDGFAEPVEARASVTVYPWALLAIALVVLQIVLLKIRNRVRRRLARRDESGGDDATHEDGAPPPSSSSPDELSDHAEEPEPHVMVPSVIDLRPLGSDNGGSRVDNPMDATTTTKGSVAPLDPTDRSSEIERELALIQQGVADLRDEAQRELEGVSAIASSALALALARADQIVDEALDARLRALEQLERAQAAADEAVAAARVQIDGVRREVEQHRVDAHQAALRATEAIRAIVEQANDDVASRADTMSSAAGDLLSRPAPLQGASSPHQLSPTVLGAAPPRSATRLDAAIERAVQKALQA